MSRASRSLPLLLLVAAALLTACGEPPWNNPYPEDQAGENILYGAFTERPKHLDPARSYSSNEYSFIAQVYEPPLQYHFLKRPYELVPLTARALPEVTFFDADGNALPSDAAPDEIAVSEYLVAIEPGIRYQPHPAFARDADGAYRYHDLDASTIARINTLDDLPETGTRELTAADYVYQIKRLATPWLHSPIAGLMGEHIRGFAELGDRIAAQAPAPVDGERPFFDLRQVPFAGAEVVDRYRYRIRLEGPYPQFVYWLAMPFFAPMPWEAEALYNQPGMKQNNLTLDWYPVGTGPFMLSENNPNLRMVLARNPNFHGERYPSAGMPGDREAGLLDDAGEPMPFVDQAIYSLEQESIPYWNKFLQGYYDSSGISSDAFDQAIKFDAAGEAGLTADMREQGIELVIAVQTSIWYMGFNMLDPLLGGDSERARLLRQAISIAVDFGEFISIFANGRGVQGQGPLPPGIFGHREGEAGINPYVFDWEDGRAVRKPIAEARALLAKAGYRDGRDPETGRPLTIYYEAMDAGPDGKARLNWMRKQFAKLGIELVVRATDYNRFQEKMRKGTGQVFMWGWNADYPDPENFFFLLYGPNRKVDGGENAANYQNEEFDALFERMKNMDDGSERQQVIDRMNAILRHDAPWSFGFYPKSFSLHHQWLENVKPNLMANNTLKYRRLEPAIREQLRAQWNPPVLWPIGALIAILVVGAIPAVLVARRRERGRAL
ncbi:ABC transporter substrate-binding protein [Halochromatium glycolicum]|uniref:Peptide ABC transporter substrate-binding protein n=1 Tax=Halochromatium glycolicum TaxID=85075 RepID=A0AAJ0U757_9GAMM|nr:ABC transporter substrate-binding protein [Halochromatium glycolicum]MBK1706554.1 peptide ABC transporter substrate-binding protein [Halochromatium glycolicum]